MKRRQRRISIMGLAAGLTAWLLSVQTGRSFYNPQSGRWLNRDPIATEGPVDAYGFALNEPLSKFDLLGQITVTIVVPPGFVKGDCGAFHLRWAINLDSPAQTDGYIVQHVSFSYNATTCAGSALTDSFEYWEALPISAGKWYPEDNGRPPLPVNDFWDYPSSPNTLGTILMTGELKFFPLSLTGNLGSYGQSSPAPTFPPWIAGASYGGLPAMPGAPLPAGPPFSVTSGNFPSIGSPAPSFWNLPAIEQLNGYHAVSRSWKCCCPWVDPNLGQAF